MRKSIAILLATTAVVGSMVAASAADLAKPRPVPPKVYYKAPPPAPVYQPQVRAIPDLAVISVFVGAEGSWFQKSTKNELVATCLNSLNQWNTDYASIHRTWWMLGPVAGIEYRINESFVLLGQVRAAWSVGNANVMAGAIAESSSMFNVGGDIGLLYDFGSFRIGPTVGVDYREATVNQSYNGYAFPQITVSDTSPTVGILADAPLFDTGARLGIHYRYTFADQNQAGNPYKVKVDDNVIAARLTYSFPVDGGSQY
jgi:hypothetical protein